MLFFLQLKKIEYNIQNITFLKMKPVYNIIDRRASKSQRNAWRVAYRAFTGIAKTIKEEEKINNLHSFTLKQYVGCLIQIKYWKPLEIKEKYKNAIDELILFVENWKFFSKKEKRAMISLMMFLNQE